MFIQWSTFLPKNLWHQACAIFPLTFLRHITLFHWEHTHRHINHRSAPISWFKPKALRDFFGVHWYKEQIKNNIQAKTLAKWNEDLSYWISLNQRTFFPSQARLPCDLFIINVRLTHFLDELTSNSTRSNMFYTILEGLPAHMLAFVCLGFGGGFCCCFFHLWAWYGFDSVSPSSPSAPFKLPSKYQCFFS